MDKLETLFQEIFYQSKLVKMVFGSKRKKSISYQKVSIRPVLLGGELLFQTEYAYEKKVTHENLTAEESMKLALHLVQQEFKQVNIYLEGSDIQILASKLENPKIIRKAGSKCQTNLEHNHASKEHL